MTPWILLSALGFVVLLDMTSKTPALRAGAVFLLLAGLTFHSARYVRTYFEDFPTLAAPYFQYGIKEFIQTIDQQPGSDLPVVITSRINQPYIYVLFFQKYSPADYQKRPVRQRPGLFGKFLVLIVTGSSPRTWFIRGSRTASSCTGVATERPSRPSYRFLTLMAYRLSGSGEVGDPLACEIGDTDLSMPPPDSKLSPFSFSSGLNALILAAAVSIGGWLRLQDLGKSDLTADEAASWLAASAPTVREVLRQGLALNPGKLALHDLTLHFWMLAFGEDVTSIRALSALLGILAIVLVFVVTHELFRSEEDAKAPLLSTDSSTIAALSALIFALNVVAIRYSREGRMYELMLDATLIQLWFFLRAVRRGSLLNYLGTALFTVLAIATSFVAGLVFLAEGLCLLYTLRPGATRWPYSWNVTVTLLAAGAIVAGLTPWHLWVEKASFFSWIGPGFLTAYVLALFGVAIESPILLLTLLLAAWGVFRGWQRYTEGTAFALSWMLVPLLPIALWLGPIMLLVVTIYSWTPLFAHRWALTSLVPLCIFIAIGVSELKPLLLRLAVLALVVVLAGVRIHSYDPNSGDVEWGVQWRAATEAALPELKAGRPVNVFPGYAMYVVRYYLRNDSVDPALLSEDNRRAQVLLLADTAESLLPNVPRFYAAGTPCNWRECVACSVLATPFAVSLPAEPAPRTQ